METTYTAEELAAMPDRIAATFNNRSVFVTGGTGFMGKVLVEKLLRKCPDIKQILLLVRPKKGKTPRQRMEDTLNDPLFEKVRKMRGGVEPLLDKMTLIAGDASEPDLGISQADRQIIIEETDIIIHAAATIRFDEELKKAVMLNVRGTKLVLQLGKQCKRLLLFIHISTAYCHLQEKILEEKPYPPPADPHKIIEAMEWMDQDAVAAVTPSLLRKLPNSYAFTKALGEALVVEAIDELPVAILRPSIGDYYLQKLSKVITEALGEALAVEAMDQLPVDIVRPSVVIPIYQEPIPGWTDNINGPTGLLIGAGKGVIRSMYCKSNSYADYLPVDVFINGIMISCWEFIEQGVRHVKVVNFTSSAEVRVTWEELIETGREIILNRVPLNGVAWYPGGSMKHSRLHHNICVLLFHWLPAILVDCLLWCLRYEPVLCRVQRRVTKGFEVFEYYTNNQWDFISDNAQKYRNDLNPRERLEYKVDASGINISEYFEDCVLSARRYILKETDDTIPAAKRHMKVMWCVDVLFRMCFWALMLYWISGWLSSTPTTITEAIST